MEETDKESPTTNPYPVPDYKVTCRQDGKYLYCNDRPNSMIMILADCDGGDMVARKAIADYVRSVGGRDVRCKGQFGSWDSFLQRTQEMEMEEWERAYNNQRLATQLYSPIWHVPFADSLNSNKLDQNPNKKNAKDEKSSKKSEKSFQTDRSREEIVHEAQAGIRFNPTK